jgi:hypothetical protein
MSTGSGFTPNITFDRTAGSHSLAAAGQRERCASGQCVAKRSTAGKESLGASLFCFAALAMAA